ncbi:type II toxin-antitoxin system Phd/YefM family antitoxin [Sphingomonas sp. GB1N7]|uniref:type II toxin-antitoxin system Phd/YefM family antitoxin n=1 Tax=Parasphingomonas caseinilytica TaxID=3096158 RepID=UPI002FC6426B
MSHYSVATTKDNLSKLIDKALAGEEVIITRHGKPTVALKVIERPAEPTRSRSDVMEWLRVRREALPTMTTSYLDLKRMDEEDGAL